MPWLLLNKEGSTATSKIKKRKKLDGVGSADFAERDFGFLPALAFGALDCAFGFGEEVGGFAEFLAENFVVEQLFFVGYFNVVFCFDGCFLFCKFFIGDHVVEVSA